LLTLVGPDENKDRGTKNDHVKQKTKPLEMAFNTLICCGTQEV